MADDEITEQRDIVEEDDHVARKLKYLDFVLVAGLYVAACISTIYDIAKENSGPFKPGVEAIEIALKTVTGPIFERLHDIPLELLKYLDRKVDRTFQELEMHVPLLVKDVLTEVQRAGGVVNMAKSVAVRVRKRYEPVVTEMYYKYEPEVEHYAAAAWRRLNKLPLFPEVAEVVIPFAAYWTEKYNQAVCYGEDRGYELAHYLPLIPMERIAMVFDEGEPREPEAMVSGKALPTE